MFIAGKTVWEPETGHGIAPASGIVTETGTNLVGFDKAERNTIMSGTSTVTDPASVVDPGIGTVSATTKLKTAAGTGQETDATTAAGSDRGAQKQTGAGSGIDTGKKLLSMRTLPTPGIEPGRLQWMAQLHPCKLAQETPQQLVHCNHLVVLITVQSSWQFFGTAKSCWGSLLSKA
jgi:hypothetical protein